MDICLWTIIGHLQVLVKQQHFDQYYSSAPLIFISIQSCISIIHITYFYLKIFFAVFHIERNKLLKEDGQTILLIWLKSILKYQSSCLSMYRMVYSKNDFVSLLLTFTRFLYLHLHSKLIVLVRKSPLLMRVLGV